MSMEKQNIKKVYNILNKLSQSLPILFPIHPRTKKQMSSFDITLSNRVTIYDALSYKIFVNVLANAKLVFTDSGGVQEETTFFNTPCITYRENTERPITVKWVLII